MRAYGMAPHWIGGIPAEAPGPFPSEITLRPTHRQTTAPDVFANQIADLQDAMLAGGQSLIARQHGNRITYTAGDHVVAEAMQVPGGFIGSIRAVPDRKLAAQTAARRFRFQQSALNGYGRCNPDVGWEGCPGEVIAAGGRVFNPEVWDRYQRGYAGYGNPDVGGGGTVWGFLGAVLGVGVLGGLIYLGWRLGKGK